MVMIVYLDKIYTTTSGWGAIMVMIVYLDKIYTTKTTIMTMTAPQPLVVVLVV
jgi:hypothetical protein